MRFPELRNSEFFIRCWIFLFTNDRKGTGLTCPSGGEWGNFYPFSHHFFSPQVLFT